MNGTCQSLSLCDMSHSYVRVFHCVTCPIHMCAESREYGNIRKYASGFETNSKETYDTLQHNAPHCTTLQHTATHCNTLQHTATQCTTLQHTAPHCNTREYANIRKYTRGFEFAEFANIQMYIRMYESPDYGNIHKYVIRMIKVLQLAPGGAIFVLRVNSGFRSDMWVWRQRMRGFGVLGRDFEDSGKDLFTYYVLSETYSYVWLNSYIVCHDSFIRVTWQSPPPVYARALTCLCAWECVCVCVCVCMWVCLCVCVCMWVCLCVCVRLHTHVCVCVWRPGQESRDNTWASSDDVPVVATRSLGALAIDSCSSAAYRQTTDP